MATPSFNLFDPDLLASSTSDLALPDLGGPIKPSSTSPVFRDNTLATLDFNITPRRNGNAKSTTPHQFMIAPDSPLAASFYKTPKKPDSIAIADELDLTLDDVLASPFNTGLLEMKHKSPNSTLRVRSGANGRVLSSFNDENRLEQPEKLDIALATNTKRPRDITGDQEIDRQLSESSFHFEERQDSLVLTPATSPSLLSAPSLPMGTRLEPKSSFNPQLSQQENGNVFGLGYFDEVFITEADLAQEKFPDDEVKTLLELTQSLLTPSKPGETDEDTVISFDHVQLCNNFVTLGTGTFILTPTAITWRGNLVGLDSTLSNILRFPLTVLSDIRAKSMADGRTRPMMLLTVKERAFVQFVFGEGKEEEPAHCIEAIRRQMDIGVKRMEEQQSLIDGGSLIRTDEAVEDADRANSTKSISTSTITVVPILRSSAARPSLIPRPSMSTSSTTYSSNSAQRSRLLSQTKSSLPQPKHTILPKATTTRSMAPPMTSALKKSVTAGTSSLDSLAEGSRLISAPARTKANLRMAGLTGPRLLWSTSSSDMTVARAGAGVGVGVGVLAAAGRGGDSMDVGLMGKENRDEKHSVLVVEPSLLAKTQREVRARREAERSDRSKNERKGSLRGASNKENESDILDAISVAASNTTTWIGDNNIGSEDENFRLALSELKRKHDETIQLIEVKYREAVEQLTSEMRRRKKRKVDVDMGEKGVTDRDKNKGPTTAASLAITTAESNVLLPPRAIAFALTTGTGSAMSTASKEPPGEC